MSEGLLLSRILRQNWKAALIFPFLLILGGGLIAWTLNDTLAFYGAIQRNEARLAWDPADIRGLAVGLPLFALGFIPLLPASLVGGNGKEARRTGKGMGWTLVLTGIIAVALLLGPAIARSLVRSSLQKSGYSECPPLNARHTTLRWVKAEAGGSGAACPTRWQDEWF